MISNSTFRNALYAGLVLAVALSVYLIQLWQPERQVQLHSLHLVAALEAQDWEEVAELIDAEYADQWGHDRPLLVSRIRAMLRYTQDLRIQAHGAWVELSDSGGEWHARITADGEENEVNAIIEQHVNAVAEPFELQWRHRSWKPWDWKLVRVTNAEFQLPAGMPF